MSPAETTDHALFKVKNGWLIDPGFESLPAGET
jgi:hypothetical protein